MGRGLCFCTAAALPAQGLVQPNPSWVGKGCLSHLCSPRIHTCPHTLPEIPKIWEQGWGLTPCMGWCTFMRGGLSASGAVESVREPPALLDLFHI